MTYQELIIAHGPKYFWRLGNASGNPVDVMESAALLKYGTWSHQIPGAVVTDPEPVNENDTLGCKKLV
ncbi:MAG TPA: hypothetical protein HPQ00_10160 [Magnetococcales bacterium]|nr:hypothetical protein [Magnetococcales bacterium]